MVPDWHHLIASTMAATAGDDDVRGHIDWADNADDVLAARIPEACPRCHGIGYRHWGDNNRQPCGHPNAPTVSDALTEWWHNRQENR